MSVNPGRKKSYKDTISELGPLVLDNSTGILEKRTLFLYGWVIFGEIIG